MPDTPTPAPALTDEQIDGFTEDVAFIYEGEYDPQPRRETFDAWLAAVIAKAKREVAEEIADALSRSIHEVRGARREYLNLEYANDVTTRSAWDQSRAEACRRIGNELNRIVREVSHGR